MKSLKDKLKNNQITLGSWITIAHTSIAEIMAKAGFDWLTIDMEHSAITMSEALRLVQVIEPYGVSPLVRVSENNPNLIKKVMDMGTHGIIVPMVNSRNDAELAVSAVRYPPFGIRGVGLSRAQGYGTDFENYRKWVEKESVVVALIEHIKAIENLEEILTTEGIDAFIVGPYDLTGSLGIPGQFDHPDYLSALEEIERVAKEIGIPAGFHIVPPEPKLVLEKINRGFSFIAYGVDFLFLGEKCREGLKEIFTNTKNLTVKTNVKG
jgi:2-keto-3-deoxy-L-rhamnonate aldolase RhmA